MWRLRFALGLALALLPSWLKVPIYRMLFGYRVGKGVRIGFSPLIGVGRCRIGDYARIGSFNLFYEIGDLEIGDHAQIGFLNLFRGGRKIRIGPYASILRQNVFNSIIERDFVEEVEPVLDLGAGSTIAAGHWLDFSAGIDIGDHTIVGGRNSSFWTHNRQRGRPISVGCHCYLGSEIRVAPGAEVPSFCIVALGSVLSGHFRPPRSLIGGNPASVARELQERDLILIVHKTRDDIPDDLARMHLPDDLLAVAHQPLAAPEENIFEPRKARTDTEMKVGQFVYADESYVAIDPAAQVERPVL
jgi:acetyltransferase-like isoleucine patch superfamily enzyme